MARMTGTIKPLRENGAGVLAASCVASVHFRPRQDWR